MARAPNRPEADKKVQYEMKKITTLEWLVLAVAVLLVKFFLLPDTAAFVSGSIVIAAACGLGALVAVNRPDTSTE
jgi:hypothetical protein